MPQDIVTLRTHQGRWQHRHQGLDGLSHQHRMRQRWGTQTTTLDLRGVRNAAIGVLLFTTLLPTEVPARRPDGFPAEGAPPSRLLPGAHAMDIELRTGFTDAPPTAADALLEAAIPAQITNVAADTAAATCTLSPRYCGIAVAVGTTLAMVAGGGVALGYMLGGEEEPTTQHPAPRTPTSVDHGPTPEQITQTLRPIRFNASELDPAHPPCQSLGAHVNARWEASTALEPGRTRLGTFQHLRDRSLLVRYDLARRIAAMPDPDAAEQVIGHLWASGMDEWRIENNGILPLQPELDAIAALSDRDQLLDHLFRATASARNPVFDFTALPDLENPVVNIAYLGQSGLGLPDSAWYGDPAKARMLEAYEAHIMRTLQLSGMTSAEAAPATREVITLEHALADASEPFSILATEVAQYHNPVNLTQAQARTPTIDWQAFFAAQGMTVPERFSLGMPRFFERLETLLDTAPLQAWKAYLRFHAVDRAAPCLDSSFAGNHAQFHDVALKGRGAQVPRWGRVLDIIEHCAGDAFSPMYVREVYPAHAADRMATMVTSLSSALDKHLDALPWMQPATRLHAQQKARALIVETGHPSQWPSWDGAATQGNDFLHDVQAVQEFTHRRNIAKVGRAVDSSDWKMTAQTVDAYMDPTQNRIILPAALLQPPFFDPAADDALNYGGIGVVLGHEMAHAFDSLGSTFDADGRMRDWWTPADRSKFDALATRLAGQFSRYRIDGRNIDGELTLDENLADLGGLSIAFEAMRQATAGIPDPMVDGMTREQRFFANFAFTWRQLSTPERTGLDLETDNHVPGRIRADGAPSNMPAFAQAFNCTPGEPMARPAGEQVRFL